MDGFRVEGIYFARGSDPALVNAVDGSRVWGVEGQPRRRCSVVVGFGVAARRAVQGGAVALAGAREKEKNS